MPNKPAAGKSRLGKILMLGFTLAIVGVFVWNLPRGYSSDLSQIGRGKNVVVQVHDHYLVASSQLMENLHRLRGEYEGKVEFVIADLQVAEGKAFAQHYNVDAVTLLFFALCPSLYCRRTRRQRPQTPPRNSSKFRWRPVRRMRFVYCWRQRISCATPSTPAAS